VTSERLGAMRREQLPDGLADAVFALAPGGVSAPVESAFGWHLFELEAVLPEQTRPFAAVRDDLARELRLRAAADRLPDLANRLEDAIAEGVSLEEAASRVGVPVREIAAVTAQGNDADERPLAQPVAAEILSVAFDTPSGETSVVGETPDGGYFVVRVDRIEPATTKPLTEIRDRLAAAWAVAERRQRARQQADALRSRAAAGESLESLQAATPGSELRAVGPLRRDDPGTSAKLTPEAVELLFATPAGAVAERVVEALDGAGVLVTDTIERGDPPPDLGPLRERLAAMLQGDLLDQYAGALRERYRPTVNETLLGTLMRTDEG
jgi:peptidyl-prolyl cis-trans isomerase D